MTSADLVRLACVGASITFGRGLANRREECYPAVLQQMLGPAWRVRNFGYSGATALRESNEPYWRTPSFESATRFAPQVTVVSLGTNDAQHANQRGLDCFEGDLTDLVTHFTSLEEGGVVLLCDPPPVFDPLPEIDRAALDATVRPAVRRVAARLGAPVVDLLTPLANRPEIFPDNLHPNAQGMRLIAAAVHRAVAALGER